MVLFKKFSGFVRRRIDRIRCHLDPVGYARSIGVKVGGVLDSMAHPRKCFQRNRG